MRVLESARLLEGASEVRALPVRASLKTGEDAEIFVHVDRFAVFGVAQLEVLGGGPALLPVLEELLLADRVAATEPFTGERAAEGSASSQECGGP